MAQTDKLGLFVEDIRRSGLDCLVPDVNASEAAFSVEDGPKGLGVRYALGALKGVGEKAMEALVVERQANGRFASARRFRGADRPQIAQPPPAREPRCCRRIRQPQPRSRGDPCRVRRRSSLMPHRRTTSAPAASTAWFGGASGDQSPAAIRLPGGASSWTLAERMTAERDAFGFYFSAHPVDAQRHLLAAHRVKSFAELASLPAPDRRRPVGRR